MEKAERSHSPSYLWPAIHSEPHMNFPPTTDHGRGPIASFFGADFRASEDINKCDKYEETQLS